MKQLSKLACVASLLLTSLVYSQAAGQEIVFDNFESHSTAMFYGPQNMINEFGDEIYLGGSARTLERLELETYNVVNELTPQKYAIIRLYDRGGVKIVSGVEVPQPGKLRYTSRPIQVMDGIQVMTADNINVKFDAGHLIWTIQYFGLDVPNGDSCGVLLYETPTIGSSYDDILERITDEKTGIPDDFFTAYAFGSVRGNFGLRLWASEAPDLTVSETEPNEEDPQKYFKVQGPTYTCFQLQSLNEETRQVTPLLWDVIFNPNQLYPFTPIPEGSTLQIVPSPMDVMQTRLLDKNQRVVSLEVLGTPGTGYMSLTSSNMIDWLSVGTNYLVSAHETYNQYITTMENVKYFANKPLPEDLEPEIVRITLYPDQESNIITLAGPRGRKVELSYDFGTGQWSKPQQGQFSYYPFHSGNLNHGLASFLFPHPAPGATIDSSNFLPKLIRVRITD